MYAVMGVTVGDVTMSDGSKLEGIGVIPDEPLVPSAYAINQGLDPILALASTKMGHALTPKEAGDMRFLERVTLESVSIPSARGK